MSQHERLDFLLAQRQILLSSFECMPSNLQDNTHALLIAITSLQKEGSDCALLSAKTVDELVCALETETEYEVANQFVIVQLFIRLHCTHKQELQCLLFQSLFDSSLINSDHTFPHLAFITNQYLTRDIAFTPLGKTPAQIHQYLLFCLYRGQQLTREEGIELLNVSMTPDTALYIELLMGTAKDPVGIYNNFVALDMCNSNIFDLFIVSLEEDALTLVLNMMSQDESLNLKVIEMMGKTGFIKFVPFLSQAMQQSSQTLVAYVALRTMLGPLLEQAISLQWQCESDDVKRCEYLQFYSAKLLDRWPTLSSGFNHARMLNGAGVDESSVEHILNNASPLHQAVARMHQYRMLGAIRQNCATLKLAS